MAMGVVWQGLRAIVSKGNEVHIADKEAAVQGKAQITDGAGMAEMRKGMENVTKEITPVAKQAEEDTAGIASRVAEETLKDHHQLSTDTGKLLGSVGEAATTTSLGGAIGMGGWGFGGLLGGFGEAFSG